MAVQATGAMAIVVADVPAVHSADDPARALFTLSLLTGIVMLAAGFLRLGSVLRFVSNAVMVGFISAVGVNIILGQLPTSPGTRRRERTVSSAPLHCCPSRSAPPAVPGDRSRDGRADIAA
jgi:MFS superfamily sulfate permease-like transporter